MTEREEAAWRVRQYVDTIDAYTGRPGYGDVIHALNDVELLRSDLRLLVGEPEWEYGETNGLGGVWTVNPDVSPELWANTPTDRRVRRVKAGEWEPVL